jgi:hypothetical protein
MWSPLVVAVVWFGGGCQSWQAVIEGLLVLLILVRGQEHFFPLSTRPPYHRPPPPPSPSFTAPYLQGNILDAEVAAEKFELRKVEAPIGRETVEHLLQQYRL